MSKQLEQEFQMHQSQPMGVMSHTTASREMEEVKGQIFLAKQFPRNVFDSQNKIMDQCKRESLAKTAIYSYPRGGQNVSGPSIRLAEVIAQNYGNINMGVKELEQKQGESVAMAYAWDMETNTRVEKTFTVPHTRKARGTTQKLTDPRDIYELVANNGARRLRACILSIIPGDIVEAAVDQCQKTLSGNSTTPLKDRLLQTFVLFKEKFKITQEMIEERFGYTADKFTEVDLVDLGGIYHSLKDGITKKEEWFEIKNNESKNEKNELEKEFKQSKEGALLNEAQQ